MNTGTGVSLETNMVLSLTGFFPKKFIKENQTDPAPSVRTVNSVKPVMALPKSYVLYRSFPVLLPG